MSKQWGVRATPHIRFKSKWFDCSVLPPPSTDTIVFSDVPDLPHPLTTERTIFLQVEPEAITGVRKHILLNGHRFTHILTYDHTVLRMFPHARKYIFGGCWIQPDEYNSIDPSKKQFKISSIVGCKNATEGHMFRLQLYFKQSQLPTVTFYRSSREGKPIPSIQYNPILPSDSKLELFKTYQFSLVVENSSQENYFTEKLIDCLITKTIPIYWGCPNIDDYFDTEGWIILETTNLSEVAERINQLDESWYSRHQASIEANFERCKQYTDVYKNIINAFTSIPNY